ncbi:MAG: CocE/NonD family hydrolase [Nitrososphaerota archaeon]|nr:CocE/NonD family hydrolase [Nitrososphaerota archaeon]
MFGKTWKTSERKFGVLIQNDVKIKTRDGKNLNSDIFRPNAEGKFPAILGIHPYLSNQSPPIRPKANSTSAGGWASGVEKPNSTMEAGDPEFYSRRGYAHVICNVRGTDLSEGMYDFIGEHELNDVYDVIEWIASQPWCNGKVGMFGVSYFGWIQQFAATTNPPHLKCIFGPYAATDFYRDMAYHGGIFSLWGVNWKRLLNNLRVRSKSLEELGEAQFKEEIARAIADEDLLQSSKVVEILNNPLSPANALAIDWLLHPNDDAYWHQRQVDYTRVNVPCYLGGDWGIYGLHLPGAFRSWENINAPKKMTVGPPVNLDRPVYQMQYESLRWFDYWLKNVDNGVMNEPPIKLYVMGSNTWKEANEWPLPETKWTPFYLHENQLLSEHEFWPNEPHDTFEDSPWGRGSVSYYSPPMVEKTEVVGPIVLNVFGSTTDNEILWFASLRDVDAEGHEAILTRGWLRGSHREIDSRLSKPWYPHHPHRNSVPLVPNYIYEFSLSLIPTANLFKEGHKIALKISSTDDPPKNTFEAMASEHVRRASPSRVSIYHDVDHPSCIYLPVTSGNVIGTFFSGGRLPQLS